MEAGKRWGEVAVAIRIVRNSASTHMLNRLREVYREYLEKYAQAVEQVCRLSCCCAVKPWLQFIQGQNGFCSTFSFVQVLELI